MAVPRQITNVSTHAFHIAGRASMRRSTMGAAARRSTLTHPATRAASSATRQPRTSGCEPASGASARTSMSVTSIPLRSSRPGQSIPPPSARPGGSSGMIRCTSRVAPATARVGRANIQCRESCSATGPAHSMPTMPPPTKSPLTTPMATLDSPAGRCRRTTTNDRGSAPTIAPCSTWPSSSTGRLGASAETVPPADTTAISRTRTRLPP